MPFLTTSRVVAKLLPFTDKVRWAEGRAQPERVVLSPADGVTPSVKPPVRIFLGTEPAQHRAERVFVWSIEQVRDPSRIYEIYLLKELAGFDRSRWTTGFTNYRFAIPHFAQGRGRAIYNDVDQVYLTDPAELFDAEMNGHGFLAISETESSVMLIDCARMAQIWSLDDAHVRPKKRLLARAIRVPGLFGPLPPEWNARDEEYEPGRSKLLHYTTLHTQPWRPLPEQYIYETHPWADLWLGLERAADAAGAQLFTKQQPSARYAQRSALFRSLRNGPSQPAATQAAGATRLSTHADAIAALVNLSNSRTVLVYGSDMGAPRHAVPNSDTGGPNGAKPLWGDARVTFYDPVTSSCSEPPQDLRNAQFDGVVCLDVLDHLPEEDIPWCLDEVFGCARRFVYAAVTCYQRKTRLPNGEHAHCTVKHPDWWTHRFETTAKRYPDLHWELAAAQRSVLRRTHLWWERGGRCVGQDKPSVWVLADDRPGNNSQSLGLAQTLGWPYEVKEQRFRTLARLPNRLLGATHAGVTRSRSTALTPPWPDLVIATGRRLAPVARWIKKQSRGRTHLVHLGRKGGHVAEHFDLAVACAHFHLPSHPNRVETLAPLNRVIPGQLAQAAERWPNLFGDAPHPHVALLVGGTSALCRLDMATARRLGEDVRAFAQAAGGTVHAMTSRRTGAKATEALRQGLGASTQIHAWQPGQGDNPYLGYLASADVIVVTGESESMLAETAASGKPVYIYPLPQRRSGLGGRLREWLVARAYTRPTNNRGTARPQQGLEYLCAWVLARGIVLPPRDLSGLHQTLIRLGVARPFGEPLETGTRPVLNELDHVARRVRALLGVQDRDRSEALTSAAESVTTDAGRA